MNKTKFTPISSIGEFELINKITTPAKINNKSTKMGVGDDAAILEFDKKCQQLISTDMLVEGVHFDCAYSPLKHVGYKAVVSSISDICAMNGQATHILISLAIPNKYSVELITSLYDGIHLACKNYNLDLIGGDTTASPNELIINVTILGTGDKKRVVCRSAANPTDLLITTGNLGAAYLGLQILEREKMIFEKNNQSQPPLDEYAYILERQLKPEPRVDIITWLKENNIIPSSMIDISDGLGSEAIHLATSSEVGIKIFEERIPISEHTHKTAKELSVDPLLCALHGGEDYELLFTLPIKYHKKVVGVSDIHIIGHVTAQKNVVELIKESGESINLTKEGWDSFLKQQE
ncbi:MAG: thiamine-phosphate kinase [Flavobacteriales bacterium]|nr:thiamine-phosphate kinase [Flavobacteriales bacterium]|tara:strand:+ start:367 stop:1416 length:1050 start_codon:yes stop_codon:yes gene_type:complete